MVKIRKGTFETNSSSTHSICICKEDRGLSIPERISINLKDYEFGWEYDKYYGTDEKLAYIIMGLLGKTYYADFIEGCNDLKRLLETIGKWVKSVNIQGLEMTMYDGKTYLEESDGYVDHASEMGELLEAILADEDLLKRYLFSTDSIIFTGNDNEDGYPNVHLGYEYEEFYKGN